MIKVKVIEDDFVNVQVSNQAFVNVKVLGEFTETPVNPYQGSYEVTPSQQEQILLTANKHLSQNVIVHPIPSNYGLITYNGYELTVS